MFDTFPEESITSASVIKTMDFNIDIAMSNVLGALPALLYSVGQLMSPPTTRSKPSQEDVFNILVNGLPPSKSATARPSEPAMTGLLILYLALWDLMSLHLSSLVFASALPSHYVALFMLSLVYILQPGKRTALGPLLMYGVGRLVILPIIFTLYYAISWRLFPPIEPFQFSIINVLWNWPLPVLANLPGIVKFQTALTLLGGLYLTFRPMDAPQPVEAMIWPGGEMWIMFPKDEPIPNSGRLWDTVQPTKYATERVVNMDANELCRTRQVGFYGPRSYDLTTSGLVLVVIGLITLFSSFKPVGENQVLHLSAPLNVVIGAVAIHISYNQRNEKDELRETVRTFGSWAFLYGMLLGNELRGLSNTV